VPRGRPYNACVEKTVFLWGRMERTKPNPAGESRAESNARYNKWLEALQFIAKERENWDELQAWLYSLPDEKREVLKDLDAEIAGGDILD